MDIFSGFCIELSWMSLRLNIGIK